MSDYLWDRAGEADPEVERLEDLLGAFAHRPRPLELPPEVGARPRRHLWPRLAAAAALLFALLAGSLFALWPARTGGGPVVQQETPGGAPAAVAHEPAHVAESPAATPARGGGDERPAGFAPARGGKLETARRASRTREPAGAGKARARAEVAESAGAKEQLVYALRLTSVKLGEVRRRVHGAEETPPAQPTRPSTR